MFGCIRWVKDEQNKVANREEQEQLRKKVINREDYVEKRTNDQEIKLYCLLSCGSLKQ